MWDLDVVRWLCLPSVLSTGQAYPTIEWLVNEIPGYDANNTNDTNHTRVGIVNWDGETERLGLQSRHRWVFCLGCVGLALAMLGRVSM